MHSFTPQEVHVLFERAFNAGEVEAILALYEPGAILVTGGESVTGQDAIRYRMSDFTILNPDIVPAAGD